MAAQWGEWDDWEKDTKAAHPIGYWMTEKLPRHLERIPEIFIDPIHKIRYYWRNRFWRKTHVLPTGFKPGEYHDLCERMLHGLFESLVDFVEQEKARAQILWGDDSEQYKWVKGRCPEAGLAHLKWESKLDDPANSEYAEHNTRQAHVAREIISLYTWWKHVRPHRPDVYEASGWSAYCRETEEKYGCMFDERNPRSAEDEQRGREILKKCTAQEEAEIDEDQKNLHRLIDIRLSLWD